MGTDEGSTSTSMHAKQVSVSGGLDAMNGNAMAKHLRISLFWRIAFWAVAVHLALCVPLAFLNWGSEAQL
jgi:hypothetical protein